MPTTTARILQSTGLASNVSAIAALEFGETSDTERPVIGATVAGPKYLGTEELISITVSAPAAIPVLKRSMTTIIADINTAGAHINLDIQNGAQVSGYRVTVICAGSADRVTIVTYGSGAVEYVPVDTSREFVWTGTAWMVLGDAGQVPIGQLIPVDFEKTTSTKFPAFPRNVNQDISITNWPLIVPEARSKAISVLGVTNHAVTVAGSIITFPVAASTTALLQLFINDGIVTNYMNGGEIANFTGGAVYNVAGTQRCVTIGGVDYTITAVDAVARTITVSVAPPAGAQSLSVYPYRVAGNANVARFLRIAGFVGVAAGDAGGEVVGGFRKMDRGQGHKHSVGTRANALAGITIIPMAGNNATPDQAAISGGNLTDGINGTPRTGKTTDPRTAGQYAYTWGAVYIP
jgi:hypothetical protein